jgi:hypothetical protein
MPRNTDEVAASSAYAGVTKMAIAEIDDNSGR